MTFPKCGLLFWCFFVPKFSASQKRFVLFLFQFSILLAVVLHQTVYKSSNNDILSFFNVEQSTKHAIKVIMQGKLIAVAYSFL